MSQGREFPVSVDDRGDWFGPDSVTENLHSFIRREPPSEPAPDLDPEDMPINETLPNIVNSPSFEHSDTEVFISWTNVPEADEYWLFGIGEQEHSQVVQTNGTTLRKDNGQGDLYTPDELDGEWFCVRVIIDQEVSEQRCKTFVKETATEAPSTPTDFTLTTPNAFTHRVNANIQGAEGVEIEVSTGGSGGPWTVEADLTAGQLPWNRSSQPNQTIWVRLRSYNEGA